MDTMLKGEIAEQASILQALKRSWSFFIEADRRQRRPRSVGVSASTIFFRLNIT